MLTIPAIPGAAAMTAMLLGLSATIAVAQTAPAPAAVDSAKPAAATATQQAYAPQKVVYHINFAGGDDSKAYGPALANMRNHIAAVGKDNIDLRVVMHGDGIGLVQDAVANQRLQGQITDLKNMGVHFLVCNNTLTSRKIDPASLFDIWPEDIVPSGVAEVAKLQQEGFAYIRP